MVRLRTIRILACVPAAGRVLGGSRAEHPAVRMSSTSGFPAGSLNREGGVSADGAPPPHRPSAPLRGRLQNRSVCWITMLVGNKYCVRAAILMVNMLLVHITVRTAVGLKQGGSGLCVSV